LVTNTRAAFNDLVSDHFAQDDVSDQVDGTNQRFKALNQNISDVAAGAPINPRLLVNGAAVAGVTDLSTGIFTAAVAPPAGALASLEYYFTLIDDATYINFANMAAGFIGVAQTVPLALLTDDSFIQANLAPAAVHYMHSLSAKKMANLSSWYYSANAGNKSFDKNTISAKFLADAEDEKKQATDERDGFYKGSGGQFRFATKLGNIPFPSYTPPR
jgi:hypothetical protein